MQDDLYIFEGHFDGIGGQGGPGYVDDERADEPPTKMKNLWDLQLLQWGTMITHKTKGESMGKSVSSRKGTERERKA